MSSRQLVAVPVQAATLTLGAVLVLWFLLALGVSAGGLLDSVPSPILFISGAAAPAGAYLGLYFNSARFRQFVLGFDLRAVTLVQVTRITGFIFFLEYVWGRLPGLFAITTGTTDMTIGITSAIVASRLTNRALTYWHVIGVAVALCSGTMGILTSGTPLGVLSGSVTSQAMSAFPLNLVLIYLGPVTLIFHLMALCILRDRAHR